MGGFRSLSLRGWVARATSSGGAGPRASRGVPLRGHGHWWTRRWRAGCRGAGGDEGRQRHGGGDARPRPHPFRRVRLFFHRVPRQAATPAAAKAEASGEATGLSPDRPRIPTNAIFPAPPWWAGPRPRHRPRAALPAGAPRGGGAETHVAPPPRRAGEGGGGGGWRPSCCRCRFLRGRARVARLRVVAGLPSGPGGSDERGSGGPGSRHVQPALHAAADLLVRVPAGGGAAGAAPAEALSRCVRAARPCWRPPPRGLGRGLAALLRGAGEEPLARFPAGPVPRRCGLQLGRCLRLPGARCWRCRPRTGAASLAPSLLRLPLAPSLASGFPPGAANAVAEEPPPEGLRGGRVAVRRGVCWRGARRLWYRRLRGGGPGGRAATALQR